jgi:hypothetical protein
MIILNPVWGPHALTKFLYSFDYIHQFQELCYSLFGFPSREVTPGNNLWNILRITWPQVFDMKAYRGIEIRLHPFLTSAIVGAEWSASHAGRVPPAEIASSTHWIRSWTGQFWKGKNILSLLEIETGFLGSPVRSLVTIPTAPSWILNSCAAYANVLSNIFTQVFYGYWYWQNKEKHLCTQWTGAGHVVYVEKMESYHRRESKASRLSRGQSLYLSIYPSSHS